MEKFQAPQSHIHPIVRGLLVQKEKIILCRLKGADRFFLPGGHIEDGESAQVALLRELFEETGEKEYKINSFIGVCENVFSSKGGMFQHEINLVFEVKLSQDLKVKSREDHIEFLSFPVRELKDCNILPTNLKMGLLEWLENKKTFFKKM